MQTRNALFLTLAAIAFGPGCMCTYIDPGSVGVKINRTGGGVEQKPLGPGYHFYTPVSETVEEYPVSMQTVVYTKTKEEGSPNNEEMNLNSVEGQPISCDVSLSFELDPDKVPQLYSRFRQPIIRITHSYVRQTIRQALQETVGQMHVADVLGKEKAAAVHSVTEKLKEQLEPFGFKIQQFTLNEIRAPETITQAIAAKNAMEQDALRAQNENKKREFEAQQRIIAAKAEAEATLMQAQAQAKANELISKSLSPALVNYMAVQKWNGTLPQVNGGSTPFINMNQPQAK